MTIATGVAKQLRYKVEGTWGTAPGATGAQLLRRVTSDLGLKKQTYASNEIRSDYQVSDMRHGIRSIEGSINGELSPGTFKDFIAAALRKAFATTTAMTGLSITVAGSGPTYTVTRGSGSFVTDGVRAGDIVRLTAGSFNAANLNKNLLVMSLTTTELTVRPLNGVALVAEGPIASATVSVPGKRVWTPTSGHLDLSYYIEHWHSDLSLSEQFAGCKINQIDISLPPTGIATIGVQFLGKDLTTAGSAYYTSPTAETTTGVLAAVNGLLAVQGVAVATLTGLNLSIKGNMQAEPVVGSNTYADIGEGRVVVDGQFTALFDGATLRDYFVNETEISLFAALATGTSAAADFVSFALPRIKVGGADKDDGEKNLIQTFPFVALYNSAAYPGPEQTTLVVQDSQA
ncbi:MAG: hypothetical protein EPO27_10610 [Betaproteobacteria bacterium]|nr:MAG: hypothetical protein EPO27_10610 [Betaproteobacteria bacterium]